MGAFISVALDRFASRSKNAKCKIDRDLENVSLRITIYIFLFVEMKNFFAKTFCTETAGTTCGGGRRVPFAPEQNTVKLNNVGLKNFMEKFPEFSVTGEKGAEQIDWD